MKNLWHRLFLYAAVFAFGAANASEWPTKPIQLVVPYPVGGSTDTLGRVVAARLETLLGQPVVVNNISGANGSLGARAVAVSQPDGYTLLLANMGILTINPHLYRNMGFDAQADLEPVRMVASALNLLVVRADLPVKSVQDLVALAKSKPQQLTYVSAGNGSSQHLAGALFERATGARMLHVPYRGGSPAIIDLVAGRVDMMFGNFPELVTWVEQGKLKPLAFGSALSNPPLPNVPSIDETVPGFNVTNWYGILARAKTPEPALAKLESALAKALADPEVQAKLRQLQIEVTSSPRADFRTTIAADYERWGKVVRDAGIKIE